MVRYKYPHIVSAWLSTELYLALEHYVKQTNKEKAEVIREALAEYLKARGVDPEAFKKEFRRNPEKFMKQVIIL
jgi:predicted metal-dependent phosphotriesterase family hydrolase